MDRRGVRGTDGRTDVLSSAHFYLSLFVHKTEAVVLWTGGVVGSGNPNTVSAGLLSQTVTLPAGKTCDYCTLQWIWAARGDGGSYIGCADISITADGTLPDFASLPSQTGNVLPGVAATAAGPI